MAGQAGELIQVGDVAGVFGVKGWLKIRSYTEPREQILHFPLWNLQLKARLYQRKLLTGRRHGKILVVQWTECETRDQAQTWVGASIWIQRAELPQLAEGEYYWADLIGLQVVNLNGEILGEVTELIATGANDVIIVKGDRERLIPYIKNDVVQTIDMAARRMVVDWGLDD